MSSPYFVLDDEVDRRRSHVPSTPFASTSAAAHHQHLLHTIQRDRHRLRTFTQDSHNNNNTEDSDEVRSPWGDFSGTTPYLYKHTNQTPHGYEPSPYSANRSNSTAPTTDPNSITTPSAFTPFRNRPAGPIFDPSSPFSQQRESGPSRSGPAGGPAPTDAFRSGAANMRARLFKEYGQQSTEDVPNSSPGGLGTGVHLGGGGGPSANSVGKQRQRTTSRPLDEDMLIHSSPVRVVDPREFQGAGRGGRTGGPGGGFGGRAGEEDDDDGEEEDDLGRELTEAEMSFVGYGVSPVKHPAAGGGEQTSWSLMGGEEPSFGGPESQLFWDEMATGESVELPFGSVRAERGRGRMVVSESTRRLDHQSGSARDDHRGPPQRPDPNYSGGPPSGSMHVRVHSDDTTNAGSSPSRQQVRHQRSFHTRVRSDETTTYRVPYQAFEVEPERDVESHGHAPSTPPSYYTPALASSRHPASPLSNASPRRTQHQPHHQAREMPSPIAPTANWTFPSDILAAGTAPSTIAPEQDRPRPYPRPPVAEHQTALRVEPRRTSYADQLFQQQQNQYLQRQQQSLSQPNMQYDFEPYDQQSGQEPESDGGDNTPTLEPHTDRSPAFSHPSRSQPGTPAATFENQFEDETDQDQASLEPVQQQQQQPAQNQQRFQPQDPHPGHEQVFHPLHPFPGFAFAPAQQAEQVPFAPSQAQYIFSPPVQQQQQFAPAPSSTHLLVPQTGAAAFRSHRRIVSFDADTSPRVGFSPQVEQSPMFQGQAFPGGQEDFGLTDLLQQARVHQSEAMYQPMGLIPEQQFDEMVADGAQTEQQISTGYENNTSGPSSAVNSQADYQPFAQVQEGRPFPSVLLPAGGNPGIGLGPLQGFPAGFHPSSSQLPGVAGYSGRPGPSFTSIGGAMANRPSNTAVHRRVTPVIPPGHDPSFNTFSKGPRVAPIDDLTFSVSLAPSSGKAPSSRPVERQMHRGFPLVVGPGTRMRPGPKAKPKGLTAGQSTDASTSTSRAEDDAGGSSGEALASAVYMEPHPLGPATQAVLDQQQRQRDAFPGSAHPSRQGSEASQSSNSPREGREDSEDASDDEGSVGSSRPTITSALIESLYTTIRATSSKRTSAGGSTVEDGMGGEGGPYSRKKGKKIDIRYRCLVAGCERYFPRKSAIVNHIQTHLEDKPFNCPAAGWSVATRPLFLWLESHPDLTFVPVSPQRRVLCPSTRSSSS